LAFVDVMVVIEAALRVAGDSTCLRVFVFPQELGTFAKYVVGRFFSVAAQNDKAYIELLFWKSVGAVREMTEGYGKTG